MSTANSNNSSLMLQQLSYHCPGLHGPDSKQRVERRTFGDFLDSPDETGRVIIPLFQRRYCWESVRVSGWFRDAVGGKRDHLGVHNSGNVVVVRDQSEKTDKDEEAEKEWILVDGQQRITTTSLLVAAIRDAALDMDREDDGDKLDDKEKKRLAKLVRRLERILYVDIDQARSHGWTPSEDCFSDLPFCRLLPSLFDRRAFFAAVTEGLRKRKEISLRLATLCGPPSSSSAPLRLRELESLAELALHKMGLTLVEVQNRVNLAQVFLWLQEKTLFSMGALLFNPHPGIDFAASDLQRNLVLASVASKSLQEQEQFYKEKWLGPLESKRDGPDQLTRTIRRYVATQGCDHVSQLEETVREVRKKFPKGRGDESTDHATEYAKFYSLYEWRLRRAAMLPPRTVPKFGKSAAQKKAEMKAVAQGKGLSSSSASEQEKKEKDLTELVDERTLRSVTEGVLEEMAKFFEAEGETAKGDSA